MATKKTTRGELKFYLSCLQQVTTFEGMSGKGMVAFCDNIEILTKATDPILNAEKKMIETLRTPAVMQAMAIVKSIEDNPNPTEADKANKVLQKAIIDEAEAELMRFKNESDPMVVAMPTLNKLSESDFFTLIEKNSVTPGTLDVNGNPKAGIYPVGVQILKSLIFDKN